MTALRTLTTGLGRLTGRDAAPAEDTTVRVGAEETVTVSFTVNGRPASVDVAPRVTLSDALRDHLGLTGTHIGCEHGVCGMCTVMVDGDAARACLLLACQLEGSEIMTVEGLGKADDLHPLQESFGRHHALQCGFCTPGMLMSAYDLLDHEPGVAAEELPEKMSGVLCRCTGYRNIMDAVAEVAEANPDGVPPPRNCASAALLPRASVGGRASAGGETVADAEQGVAEIRMPQTEPTVAIEVDDDVAAGADAVWDVMDDTERLARCLPGAELMADFGDDRYKGRIRVALGPVKLAFVGDIHVVERDPATRTIRALAQAQDAGGGSVQADVLLSVEPQGSGSVIHAQAGLHMTGRIAQFGRSLAGDVSRDMFKQFTTALDATARGEEPTSVAPPSAIAMATQLAASRARATLQRLTRRN
ncbi:xanthine dehydrogenase family Fe-S subunit [Georgenia subflava]|uniref:2Fe-2S iron-sulfur cluster binding domain-containing protein n=1 Tax=Georgenia subflava TaxID=1622177 RepID=A0A6N7EBZ2_9MICO|nr:2Fe-2S iron-sulfur cluster-binding protein [Georgenia subflava]MPV35490.1 2Fe-2S iron-sulfur cluster binding domain-containing protein [Georgenia subflava]